MVTARRYPAMVTVTVRLVGENKLELAGPGHGAVQADLQGGEIVQCQVASFEPSELTLNW